MKKFFKKFKSKKVCALFICVFAIISTFCVSVGAESPLISEGAETINYLVIDYSTYENAYNGGYIDLQTNISANLNGTAITYDGYYTVEVVDKTREIHITGVGVFNEDIGVNTTKIAEFDENGTLISAEDFKIMISKADYDGITSNITQWQYHKMSSVTINEKTETVTQGESITSIMIDIATWIPSAIGVIVGLFWANGSLTFFGILAVAGLSIAVILLIIQLIRSFLEFRR